jgi:hypothetical protein
MDRVSDRQLATLIGAVLAFVGAWPLLFLRLAPYQDLPDHLATTSVLLNPERFPEYVSNGGWFRANSLLVTLLYVLSKGLGVLEAGRVVPVLVAGAIAFALPHFLLSFADRPRLLVGSLVMAPMVHNWWTLMGMLNFVLGFAMALPLLGLLAKQLGRPAKLRAWGILALAGLLWFTHAIVLLLVGLLALIEVIVTLGGRDAKARAGRAVLTPLAPVGLLALITIVLHAAAPHAPEFGHVDSVRSQPTLRAIYDLWAHWFLGLSLTTMAGLLNALVLVFFAARAWRQRTPFFSIWALAVLAALYFFLPVRMPGFGFVCERVLPFLWVWALVRLPAKMPTWLAGALVVSSVAWSVGLGFELFAAEAEFDEFTAAAPEVPPGAQLLTLNFTTAGWTASNMWTLTHASGMYTVLSGAHPQDLWADSASMPFRHARRPTVVEDPVRIREFLGVADSRKKYCAMLEEDGFLDADCDAKWRAAWAEFWTAAVARYDYVLLWDAPPSVRALVPPALASRMVHGRLELLKNANHSVPSAASAAPPLGVSRAPAPEPAR